ncbi:MAG: exodeoxyribonuclease III [Legionellaceae bacterium]|nr:exodeoxyribonuclease III [Legionellaceae bacterium]
MKVVSFNANGIRAAIKAGFLEWMETYQPDVVCLQEVKAHTYDLHEACFPAGYYCQYVDAVKKGYSGVAIFARKPPLHQVSSLGFPECDTEGRYLRFDYENLSIISVYMPSGTTGDTRQQVKYLFLEKFAEHLKTLKASGRSYIICGDFNIAHKEIDLKNWKSNQKNSGFLPEERAWMDKLFLEWGFVDAFRAYNTEPDQYTWWSYRARARDKNVGWRIDYQVITPDIQVLNAGIVLEPRCSDHAPLWVEYKQSI